MTTGARTPAPKPDASMVFGIALLVSLALWLPLLGPTLAGRTEITTSALRYLAGLAVAWTGVWVVASVWVRYEHAPSQPARTPDHPLTAAGAEPTANQPVTEGRARS